MTETSSIQPDPASPSEERRAFMTKAGRLAAVAPAAALLLAASTHKAAAAIDPYNPP